LTIALASVLIFVVTPGIGLAGVVMGETSTAQAANGATFSVDKTVYVQGNKQRVEERRVATITDLDKSVIYLIDKTNRAYVKVPLKRLSDIQPGNVQSETVDLSSTGQAKVIANQPCKEYRTVEGNELEHVIISVCMSTNAPGAKEIAAFDRKMAARLSGGTADRPSSRGTASLMLEKQSVLSFRVRGPSPSNAYHTTSLKTQTRINKIELKSLPGDTFMPPKGYSMLQNRPRRSAPSDFPEAPVQTALEMTPNLAFHLS